MDLKIKSKKAQVSINSAPAIVLTIGLVFLLMATLALVGTKYQDSFTDSGTYNTLSEKLSSVDNSTGERVANADLCGFDNFAVLSIANGSVAGTSVPSANYTITSKGDVICVGDEGFADEDWYINYTYTFKGTACNVTTDLNTEISNNTSIAGIVLTISLVGIVLSVLIGIFVLTRRPKI